MSARVDWPALARVGLGSLRLAPETFWALTPFELALIAAPPATAAIDAAALRALMALDPDRSRAAAEEKTG
jgi:uncharacterized phage protein (TIGR02216 family)